MNRIVMLAVLVIAALFIPLTTYAQHVLRGHVEDAVTGEALIGVAVRAEGTTLGTVTDLDGNFELHAAGPARRLVFSFVGYETKIVDLEDAAAEIQVALAPRMMDLQPVIVSASRTEEQRSAAPVAIAALTASQIKTSKPNMLSEALNTLPGVHVTNLGNEQHAMSIRQPLSYKALFAYLEDGIPIRPVGIFNHNALIEINMAGMERVEVVRGPSSSLYGSNAIGGAINFITPRPSQTPTATLSLRTDNYGYRRGDFEASTTTGKFGLYGGGYVARQRDGWSEHSDFDKVSLTLRGDYTFTPTTRLTTTFSTNHLKTDTNGNLDSLNFYTKGFTSLQTFTYREVYASRLTSQLDHVWNARNSTNVALYWRKNSVGQLPHYRIRNLRNDPARALGEVNEDGFWSLGLNVQHRTYLNLLNARLITGVSIDRSPNSYLAHFIDIDRDPESGRYLHYEQQDSLLTDYDVDLLNSAAYAQFELSPVARLRLVASLRYDRIDYGYDNHLPPSAFSGAPDERNRFNRLSPRAGLTYDLGGGRGLYANYSRGFLPPEVGELYRGVKVPTLQPSTFDSYEAGGWLTLWNGRLNAEASVYRMDGTNEIISVRLEDGSSENRNAGRTRHTGIEYAVVAVPVRDLTIRLSGTNARHEFIRYEDQGQRLDGNLMDAAPGWMANAEVTYRPRFLEGARAGFEWEHVGPYYMDPQNTLRYGGYDVFNIRLGYTFRMVELWANVLNVTDELYASIASKSRYGQQYNPGAPRSISFGVGYRFGQ